MLECFFYQRCGQDSVEVCQDIICGPLRAEWDPHAMNKSAVSTRCNFFSATGRNVNVASFLFLGNKTADQEMVGPTMDPKLLQSLL